MKDFKTLFNRFKEVKVGVVGDVMLDSYIWGRVDRISPEAPVPIVSLRKKEERIGGAGNVALNCSSLGAQVSIFSVTGNDQEATQLQSLLASNSIDGRYLIQSSSRITTNKTRIISRNQQMMRLDAEITADLDAQDEEKLIDAVTHYVNKEKPDVIIFEDYNKGVLTATVIAALISLCKSNGIVTAVDPKRKNFFSYKNVDIFKPNLLEVRDALNMLLDRVDVITLADIHEQLQKQLKHHVSFITLSEMGVFYQQEEQREVISSHVRQIADVSGAGDTVIAVAAIIYAITKDVKLMAEVANIAGGLVCEEVGTAAINQQRLLEECELLLR